MLVLVSGATATMRERSNPWLGELIVPAQGASLKTLTGRPWAADNSAFTHFDSEKFLVMLEKFQAIPRCLFVAVPDVVADAPSTMARFWRWAPVVRRFGYPVALVAQDGLTAKTTPWTAVDAIFIGGSTEWKLGNAAREIVAYARARGKWAHMGRVNSIRRLRYAERIGVDSVDGSGFSKFPKAMLARADRWHAQPELRL